MPSTAPAANDYKHWAYPLISDVVYGALDPVCGPGCKHYTAAEKGTSAEWTAGQNSGRPRRAKATRRIYDWLRTRRGIYGARVGPHLLNGGFRRLFLVANTLPCEVSTFASQSHHGARWLGFEIWRDG